MLRGPALFRAALFFVLVKVGVWEKCRFFNNL